MNSEKDMVDDTLLQDMKTRNLNFGEAIEALKNDQHVARTGWNGKDMRIFLIRGRTVEGDKFREWPNNANAAYQNEVEITLCDHIDMKAANGEYVTGWLASQTDILAEDWYIVE